MGRRWRSLSRQLGLHSWTIGVAEMRITISIDDQSFANVQRLVGVAEKSAVMRAALEALVEREAGRRPIRAGRKGPDAKALPRRRS
ncbi:MAG TPA: type II toxin-antitoxin system VapB family antitoxin [Bradyrhizobium sp.]